MLKYDENVDYEITLSEDYDKDLYFNEIKNLCATAGNSHNNNISTTQNEEEEEKRKKQREKSRNYRKRTRECDDESKQKLERLKLELSRLEKDEEYLEKENSEKYRDVMQRLKHLANRGDENAKRQLFHLILYPNSETCNVLYKYDKKYKKIKNQQ